MTGPTWKVSRRLNYSVSETGKELAKRPYAPGQHGKTRRVKLTNYGIQKQEKQRIRNVYQLSEKQFYNTYKKASRKAGSTGENFLVMLESRLDNLVYRLGFAPTRRAARQLVNHGHILVNGKKVDIPSYQVTPGQEISVAEKSRNNKAVVEALEAAPAVVDYVEVDKDNRKGKYVRYPERSELFQAQPINELLVVEYYNR
jgi:small subunit ribosomal protein S4